jgi:hypothetical protein
MRGDVREDSVKKGTTLNYSRQEGRGTQADRAPIPNFDMSIPAGKVYRVQSHIDADI